MDKYVYKIIWEIEDNDHSRPDIKRWVGVRSTNGDSQQICGGRL